MCTNAATPSAPGGTSEQDVGVALDPSPNWSMMTSPTRRLQLPERRVVYEPHGAVTQSVTRPRHALLDGRDARRTLERDELVHRHQPEPARCNLRRPARRVMSSTTTCFGVGTYRVNPNQYTLVERYAFLLGTPEVTRTSRKFASTSELHSPEAAHLVVRASRAGLSGRCFGGAGPSTRPDRGRERCSTR